MFIISKTDTNVALDAKHDIQVQCDYKNSNITVKTNRENIDIVTNFERGFCTLYLPPNIKKQTITYLEQGMVALGYDHDYISFRLLQDQHDVTSHKL